ncbi:MAG: cell wall hydrolase [Lachnospiraceae bacterium]
MKRNKWQKAAILILTASLCFGMLLPVYAEKSEETKKLEEELDQAQSENKRLQGILKDLDSDLSDAQEKLTDIEEQIATENRKLKDCEAQLTELKARSEEYYEAMKLRIQYMYENGNTSILSIFLSSDSLADALNQLEYFSSMTKYDRDQLDVYEDMLSSIREKKNTIIACQEELKQLQNKQNEQITMVQQSIAKTRDQKAEAAEAVKEADANLQEQLAYEKELEEQKAREDAKRLEEIKRQEEELKKQQEEKENQKQDDPDSDSDNSDDSNGSDNSSTEYSAEDLELMAAIIQCEAEGEPYAGKLAVGSVVMNRVHSSYFPNTILGVIYQKGQFSPVASGRFATRLAAGSNATCTQAAREVLDGNITVPYLFFRVNTGTIDGYVLGNHVFY